MSEGQRLDQSVLLDAVDELMVLYQGFPWESQLWREYGPRRSPYRVLVLFGLSARTRDHLLVAACSRLFALCPDPASLLEASAQAETIQNVVRAGQVPFIQSAVRVMEGAGMAVPRSREQLMEIRGVGEKIAECVTAYGRGREALPVDGNGRRVVDRIYGLSGGDPTRHVRYLRSQLKEVYHRHRSWMAERSVAMIDLHELLRLHGQVVCTRTPDCGRCPVSACRSRNHPFSGSSPPTVDGAYWQDWRALLLEPGSELAGGRDEHSRI